MVKKGKKLYASEVLFKLKEIGTSESVNMTKRHFDMLLFVIDEIIERQRELESAIGLCAMNKHKLRRIMKQVKLENGRYTYINTIKDLKAEKSYPELPRLYGNPKTRKVR